MFPVFICCSALVVIWQRQLLLLNNHVSPYENTSIRHLLFEWHLRHKITFADGCHCENVYILWNRLDRTCYECIDYTIMYHMKHWSPDICLGFPQNSHKLCLKIAMIIINKCCIAHWTVLIHISMYFVRFSFFIHFYKGFTGFDDFLVLRFMFRGQFYQNSKI